VYIDILNLFPVPAVVPKLCVACNISLLKELAIAFVVIAIIVSLNYYGDGESILILGTPSSYSALRLLPIC
jgi:hypothetical protein